MSMTGFARMNMPRLEALEEIGKHIKYRPVEEIVSLPDAVKRVAARDIVSRLNVPDVKCSRWDGICFSWQHYLDSDRDVSSWQTEVDYIFSNTGIPVFQQAFDTMVMIEKTTFHEDRLISIDQKDVVQGQHMIPKGERMAIGETIVQKGTLITPSHLNLLATGGVIQVPVLKKPIVALLPSGNELVSCYNTPTPGQTIESNTFSMAAKVRQWGGKELLFPIARDEHAVLRSRLKEAAAKADIVVICGGSGRGRFDLLQEAASDVGELYFSSVEHGPGKRTCFSLIDGTPVFGLVGPPGGEEMTFDFYVRPALLACLGQPYRVTEVQAVLDEDIAPHHRTDFIYTIGLYRVPGEKMLHARPLPHSRLDRSIAEHNGYLFVHQKGPGHKKGETVMVELRTGHENV
ncbi:molybdopterin molybdotransferase MoeA [Sediminispirochaeta bajacaliforniensis]|uniref:molybdopterin molybdotransferase MoeA n=1 Tax=Sediminispirochaeta bajacaliforniensis TaxID=148 RepID=UPI0003690179|nr:molybdopterin molybdotransferase MoeA [Sediminispirochaeta bajacaliforniensis]